MVTRPVALDSIQNAVEARLTADETLMALVTGVFEEVNEGQELPYVSYGQHVDGPFYLFGSVNHEGYFLLDIWSNASDNGECYAIVAEVRRLLVTTAKNPPLEIEGYGGASFTYEWSTIQEESEFNLRHMPVRFLTRALETEEV